MTSRSNRAYQNSGGATTAVNRFKSVTFRQPTAEKKANSTNCHRKAEQDNAEGKRQAEIASACFQRDCSGHGARVSAYIAPNHTGSDHSRGDRRTICQPCPG